jgi:hypothetical protein
MPRIKRWESWHVLNFSKAIRLLGLCLVLATLVACTRQWYFSIEQTAKGDFDLCISLRPSCSGEGVQLAALEITEIDRNGDRKQTMWLIEARSERDTDNLIKAIRYGRTPDGWVEVSRAKKLMPNTTYSVLGEHYFYISNTGNITVQSRESFHASLTKN